LSNGATRPGVGRKESEPRPTWRPAPAEPGAGAGPVPACLHRLFEAAAARAPGAVAVTIEGRHLTYAELDARAERLARGLRGLGVGPEVLVGIFVERSADLLVAVLGVLKAGGAYVPLDPAYPADRLALILDDARVPILLTQSPMLGRLPAHEATVVLLDDAAIDALPPGDGAGVAEAGPASLAYVIYTSGSTGRPKGVAVTHANVIRLFASTRRWFGFSSADVWTLFHSFAFDFSVWEIWGALLHGGRLVVVPYWVSRSPDAFLRLLRDEGVTVLNQTPSAFRGLVHAEGSAPEGVGPALRLVIFGGEALEPRSLRPWFDRHGDGHPQLINMYGITETTVHVTYRPVTLADAEAKPGGSPIGRPIPDLRLYLLDGRLEPVPIGVVGELYVGGPGLARGYLDDPALTAGRFLPDPFGNRPGARIYRSGDLARRRPDGDLDYVGRSDDQVKIRGFRIEPGEVESALLGHPGVREAVVLAGEAPGGDRRLLAYLVPADDATADPSGMREWLGGKLPTYMIPSAFVPVDALPLTAHGKVDRAALLTLDPARGAGSAAYVEPRAGAEATIAGAWAEVLGVARVGAHDHFFDLGGHSLLATQAASRLRDALGVEVPVRLLFEEPTVAGLAARLEAPRSASKVPAAPPIRRAPREADPPPSFAQESLWYLDQLAAGEATFNVSASARAVGPLDVAAFRRALDEMARRHEALRTTFAAADGRPVQVIAPALSVPLATVDLTGLPPESRAAEAARLADEEARRPFDLADGPLVRSTVFALGDRDHAVLLTMHHIITDGWSFGVAAAELSALYAAFRDGKPSPLPEPAVQYADYAAWQRDWLEDGGEAREALLAYWRDHLRGVRPLELPTDRPRPAVRSSRGDLLRFALPAGLSRALVDLGRREGATPFMTLLAAFQVLLGRASGQEVFAVGSPIANRNRAEVEPLIGYFINMLALRADLSGDPTFLDVLARVREAALGAYEHQDLPLELLTEALRPDRDQGRTPLFRAMFVLQNNRLPDVGTGDLALEAFGDELGTGTAKFDLSLAVAETPEGLVGSLEYATDLFDAATIARALARFRALLEAVVSDPARRVSDLDPATEDDLKSLAGWNATGVDVPPGLLLHRLFEAQAARTPDALAVAATSDGRSLSYRALDVRADGLARRLRSLGVGPEARVGIGIGRSVDFAVALLGTLKAGAAFVPLDPAYPSARLGSMIRDAGVAALLVDRDEPGRWDAGPVPILRVDLDAETDVDAGRIVVATDPDHPAYVIFTSGSTGRPRGVAVTHRSVVNHALAAARLFGLTPADRVLQFASPSFDIAIEEIFPAWSAGATVVLRGDDLLPPAEFARFVEAGGITVLDLPTAYWHAWVAGLAESGARLPEGLRLVVVGGEEALARAFATWTALGGDRVRWINTYGPTEATVIATAFEPTPGALPTTLPIGGPIANTQVHVLDDRMRPRPIGVAGELYIGGAGVARGYLDRPGPTAERFVPDPIGGVPGARLYRTGDLARWRADGTLEFLGRTDDQVKVRGFRVEPGEVESAVLACPGVREAAVSARDGVLAAYVVPRDGHEVDPGSIRRALKDRLPPHLVPTSIVALASLPITGSGKVDRAALPAPGRPDLGRDVIAPRDEVEARLVAIWEDLLPARPIGVADDFFELGGHSMLAVRLLAKVEEGFGRRLGLATLFRGATIEDIAPLLRPGADPATGAEAWSPLVTIRAGGPGPAFFCVHPAGGIVYCFQDLARRLGDRPFYGLQSRGIDDDRTPLTTIEEMAARYVEELRRAQPAGPYHVGGWSLGGLVAFEMARQLVDDGHEVATVALLDAGAPSPTGFQVTGPIAALARELEGLDILGDVGDPVDDAIVVAAFGDELARGLRGSVRGLIAHLRGLDPEARRASLLRHFGLDRVYHLETGPERVARLLRVLRANLLAGTRYAPTTPYPGRLAVFRAADRAGSAADPELGWGRLALGGVSCHAIPGDHYTILGSAGVGPLADALRSEIDGSAGGRR